MLAPGAEYGGSFLVKSSYRGFPFLCRGRVTFACLALRCVRVGVPAFGKIDAQRLAIPPGRESELDAQEFLVARGGPARGRSGGGDIADELARDGAIFRVMADCPQIVAVPAGALFFQVPYF